MHKPLATATARKAAYEAAIAALDAEKEEAEQRKHAPDKHARENGEQRRKAIRQESEARLAASDSHEAEELSKAQQAYDNTPLCWPRRPRLRRQCRHGKQLRQMWVKRGRSWSKSAAAKRSW